MMAMPCARASRGPRSSTRLPSILTSPLLAAISPPRTRMSVDLPAPFSPTSAWTSPVCTSKSTPRRARTPPKDFVMASSRASSAMAHSAGMERAADETPAACSIRCGFRSSEHRLLAIVLVDVLLGDHVGLGEDQLGIVGREVTLKRLEADVHGRARHEIGIVETGRAVLTFLDQGERLLLAISGGEHEHVLLAGGFEGLYRAEHHRVVFAEDDVGIGMRLKLVFGSLQTLLLRPRTPALAKHLKAGVALIDELSLDQALEHAEAPVAADLVALRARQQDHLDRRALHLLCQPLADEIAVLVVGRAHLGDDMRLGVNARIHHDDLDSGLCRGVRRCDEALGIARVQDEKIHALRDHVLDVGDLLAHVVLAVGLRHLASGFLGLVHGGGALGCEIGSAQRVHRNANLAVRG